MPNKSVQKTPDHLISISALIVDDESLARKTIRYSLKNFKNWHVCGECERGDNVLTKVKELQPDIVFLDIKMPGINGLNVCIKLQSLEKPPLIIFITAYDEHAVEAFELCVLDYLLKPYNDERFEKAIQKAESQLKDSYSQSQQIAQLNKISNSDKSTLDTLVVRSVGRIQLINVEQVNWLSTAGNYVELHLKDQVILHRTSLSYLEKHLDNDFVRVHRTAMLRLSQVKEFLTVAEGQYCAVLKNGDQVTVSQSYKDTLLELLGI